ncbi:hypothetical protein Dda_0826 [Drechslerella dactyloides]|uniref:LysM domain-containing protein n=1 Tax=Drechslerella dactyloides TaxID=74499 RepID=A0AAD6J6C2_DREDA|nr:hypothetical protein Dda_0826 [Drechslerella dactyloides]
MFPSSVFLSFVAVAQLAAGRPLSSSTGGSQWPTESDTASNCNNWIQGFSGDNCNSLAAAARIPLALLLAYNPALAKNCNAVKDSWGYCVSISDSVAEIPTVTGGSPPAAATTKPAATTPAPEPSSFVRGPALPEQFPPKKGQLTQCIKQTTSEWPPFTVLGADLNKGIEQACTQILPGGSKFLAPGNAYVGTVKLFTQLVYFDLKIWLGGFPVPHAMCVTQMKAAIDACHFGDPKPTGTFGGCSYTDDGNLQACVFPSVGRA